MKRRVTSFDFAIACHGLPQSLVIPGRAEVIGLDTVLAQFGAVMAEPLEEPFQLEARFVFTHFVGGSSGGFLLGGQKQP